jgi:hypothetical protein
MCLKVQVKLPIILKESIEYASNSWRKIRKITTCSPARLGNIRILTNYAQKSPRTLMGGDLYDHLMSTRILTLIINKILIWAPSSKWKVNSLNLDLLTILSLAHVQYRRRSGLVGKSNHWRPIYLRGTSLLITIVGWSVVTCNIDTWPYYSFGKMNS